mgnify:CR=1 FL=1
MRATILQKIDKEREKSKKSMGAKKQYTKEQLLNDLYELSEKLDRQPIQRKTRNYGIASETTYRRYFPGMSWDEINNLAGVEKKKRSLKVYSDDYMLDRLAKLIEETPHRIRWVDIDVCKVMPSSQTYSKRFGSLRKAIKLARERIE